MSNYQRMPSPAGGSGTSSLTDRGAWTTTTVYAVGDVVTQSGSRYVCNTAHTAGTFATDLAAAKWTVLGDASGQAAAAQTAAQTYAAAQDQATVAKLSFGQRNGSVIPFQPAPTIGQEIWQLANFQGGYNTTVLAPSITANGTNLTTKTRMFIGNMGNGDTSYRLEFDYSLSLNGWGGVSVLLTDAGGSAQGGAVRQYLIGSATNVKTGHVIFDFKSLPSSNISYFEVQLESINNSTTGSISISNVTFKRTGNEKSRPMLITKDGAGGTWPDCYFQSYDEKTRTWKIAELQFGTDGVLTPAYSLANGFATDALFNGGKIALGDPLFGQATQGSNSNPDAANVTVSTSAASMTAASLRGGNNDQVMEVWNGTAYELRCNTHGGETIRGAASYKIDTGSGLAAWTLATGLRPCRRFQVSIPTQVATTTATTFANVDHTFTVFADGVIRCDRTTTFLVDTLVRSYFEWMSSHSTQRGYIGRIGRGNLVLHEIDTISKLAAPVAPTLATSTTGGTLPAGTFFYKTTKLTAFGETTGSPSTSQVTTGTTSSNTVTFVGDANATGYGIYRGTVSGQETLIGYAPAGATSYVDTNATVPAPAAFPPVANKARLYNSAIDTQNAATTDAAWAAWYDAPTGWTFGNIYDRDSPLTRSQVGNVRSRLEGVTGSIAKNYANLEWVGADTTTLVAGTVFTATHYTFVYTPVSGDRWHDEIAARAASLSTLATMYPNT